MLKSIILTTLLYTSLVSGCVSADNDINAQEQDVQTNGEVALNLPENLTGTLVTISTEYGDITVLLYDDTPQHRDNFIKLVSEGYYEGLLFHRVMQDFMIQGGDPDSKTAAAGTQLGNGGPGYTIPAEFNPDLFHKKGALAAARQPDQVNPNKESSGSQFYIVQGTVYDSLTLAGMASQLSNQTIQMAINTWVQTDAQLMENVTLLQQNQDQAALSQLVSDLTVSIKAEMMGMEVSVEDVLTLDQATLDEINAYEAFSFSNAQIEAYTTIGGTPFLDMNYTVFGEVISGLEVIDQIAAVETDQFDRPKVDVKMNMSLVE